MLNKRHILTALLASALSVTAVSVTAMSASAATALPSDTAPSLDTRVVLEAQRAISPAEAKSIARRYVPGGEVVDIKRRGDTYSVRVIAKSGEVIDVLIDANTGRVK